MEYDDTRRGVALHVEDVPKPEYLVGLPVEGNPQYGVAPYHLPAGAAGGEVGGVAAGWGGRAAAP
jgi:hypothetical protein